MKKRKNTDLNTETTVRRIVLITGGQRSGKSLFAEKYAKQLQSELNIDSPLVYLATSQIQDEDFAERVAKHQSRRGTDWITIEEPRNLSRLTVNERVVLVECITLWSSNVLFALGEDAVDEALDEMRSEIDGLLNNNPNASFIFVSNEIGLGGTSTSKLQRNFTDLVGLTNRYVAALCDEVHMMLSGIPVRIK